MKGWDEWKQISGNWKNHLAVSHHPNGMLIVRMKMGSAMFVLVYFGRYPVEVANLEMDVVGPFSHIVKDHSS